MLPLTVLCAVAFLLPLKSQEQNPAVKIRKVPAQQTHEVAGDKLFQTYCAVCHGKDEKGNGPAAPALKTAPPDLTLLAKNNNGTFPDSRIFHILSNPQQAVHGSKDMPIWGPIFRGMSSTTSTAQLRASNLTEYLKSIQAK
ncbi:MAG TPA: cytochrome c [Terriglobia bacterium]|nr:cytochrome c [Terriglobia bacterium]